MLRLLPIVTVLAALPFSSADSSRRDQLQTIRHVFHPSSGVKDPPTPIQPKDFVIVVSNFCNTTANLSTQDRNLWEGSFQVPPPAAIASQLTSAFKYGFEVKADPTSERINGTVLYQNPFVFIDFFSVPNEWGIEVEFHNTAAVETIQADVGPLSVYNIIVGHGQDC